MAQITEGEVNFNVEAAGKPCKTWYRIYGDLKGSKRRPLVALHGGPGMGCTYLQSLQDLAADYGIPVILYDQLGVGRSTLLPEKKGDASFWTVELFLSELENLLNHLGIQDDYDVYGNSWGGMLGAEHAVTQPKGLHSVIVADSPASMVDWLREANRLRSELPQEVQDTLTRCEAEDKTETEEYENAVIEFYKKHVCRVWPFPPELIEMFEVVKRDPTVYHTMNGPSEFHVIGSLKNWDIKPRLHNIRVPVLLINGQFDEATDAVVEPFFNGLQKVRWITIPDASHTPHIENRGRFMRVVEQFLGSV